MNKKILAIGILTLVILVSVSSAVTQPITEKPKSKLIVRDRSQLLDSLLRLLAFRQAVLKGVPLDVILKEMNK